jgi:hypothetical protein
VVAPSADWQVLDKTSFEELEKSTDRWNIVFHDSSPRFSILNEVAAWAKTEIKEKPFKFGVVDVEKNVELAKNLDVDYVPLMITIADGQVHDYYSYLNDKDQLVAWLQVGLSYLICLSCDLFIHLFLLLGRIRHLQPGKWRRRGR